MGVHKEEVSKTIIEQADDLSHPPLRKGISAAMQRLITKALATAVATAALIVTAAGIASAADGWGGW